MQESPGNAVTLVSIGGVRNRIFNPSIQPRLQRVCLKRIGNANLMLLFFG